MNFKNITYLLLKEAGIGLALLLIILIFSFSQDKFFTIVNISNIFTQISINAVIATGMTFVILLGGIDLSVGSVIALCSVVSAKILIYEGNSFSIPTIIAISIFVSVLTGTLVGTINGLISEKWKIHSFIVTLGMLNIARGLALKIGNARTIFGFPDSFNDFGNIQIFHIPIIFIITLVIIIIGIFILKKTIYGRLIYAIGNNEEAVRLSGHNTMLYKVIAFAICGGSTGIAAVLYMLRLNIANPILGNGFELNAIAAVVIGGTSLFGGKGSLLGTFLGACIIGVLNNGLLLIGLGDFSRQIVTGAVIILAVIIDVYREKIIFKMRKED